MKINIIRLFIISLYICVPNNISGMKCLGIKKDKKYNKKSHTNALRTKIKFAHVRKGFIENPDNCGCKQEHCFAKSSVKQEAYMYNQNLLNQTETVHTKNYTNNAYTDSIIEYCSSNEE